MKTILLLTIIFLASCRSQLVRDSRTLQKIHERSPELFKTTVQRDSVAVVDSFSIKAKEITRTELDSLLAIYCGSDTIYKDTGNVKVIIRDRILNACKLENMLPETTIRHENDATATVTVEGNTLKVTIKNYRVTETKTETIPQSDWEAFQQISGWAIMLFVVGFIAGAVIVIWAKD